MGCNGSKGQGPDTIERPSRLTVWGDHFNSDTRALLGILAISQVPYVFHKVNMLNEEHRKESYLIQNPSGQIPMITEGQFKVLGGGNTLITYLVNQHKSVAVHLYPEALKGEIEKFLNWFQSKMRPETSRLVRMIVPSKVLGGTPPSADEKAKQKETIYGQKGILSVLNGQLGKTNAFVCGDQMSVVDVLFYCEISTIFSLTLKSEEEMGANNPNINRWYLRMKGVNGMNELDHELAEIVTKFDLAEK